MANVFKHRRPGPGIILPQIAIIFLLGFGLQAAFAENMTISTASPTFYSYDCNDNKPSSYTQSQPWQISKFNTFSYFYEGKCYVTLLDFDLTDMPQVKNMSGVKFVLESRGNLKSDFDLSGNYVIDCNLFYFPNQEGASSTISASPSVLGSAFPCTTNSTSSIETTISLNTTMAAAFQSKLNSDKYHFGFMIFPNYSSAQLTSLTNNHYEFAIDKFSNKLKFDGDGFYCFNYAQSDWCSWFDNPWNATSKMMGQPWIGDWFYVLIWFPFPMVTFLATRNGTYAGFLGLGIMLVIESINRTVFEVALSMVLLSAGFGFYELFKKLME